MIIKINKKGIRKFGFLNFFMCLAPFSVTFQFDFYLKFYLDKIDVNIMT